MTGQGIIFEDNDAALIDVDLDDTGLPTIRAEQTDTDDESNVHTENSSIRTPKGEALELEVEDEILQQHLAEHEEEEDEAEINGDNNTPLDSNVFTTFATELKNSGVIPDLPDEVLENITDFDSLSEAISAQMNHSVMGWQQEYKQNLLQNLVNEGIIKADQIKDYLVPEYSEADIVDNEEIQDSIFTEYFKEKGFDNKKIKKFIDSSLNKEDDALEYYKELQELKKEKSQNVQKQIEHRQEAERKAVIERDKTWKETIEKTNEFIPGRKINPSFKKDVYENIMPTFSKINNDLTKYGAILSFLDKYGILEGNFEQISKTVKAKEVTNSFERLLKNGNNKVDSSLKEAAFASLKRK